MKQLYDFLQASLPQQAQEYTAKLQRYCDLVLKYNENINLTAITDPDQFEVLNLIDSLSCMGMKEMQRAERVIDVGTGAGLPGIPLAVVFPEKRFVLMDSLGKRIRVITEIADDLGLQNVQAIHARAEDLASDPEYREQFDVCVSRAVSRLSVLSEYCLPFVRKGGTFLSYKGEGWKEEAEDAENALKTQRGRILSADELVMKTYGLSHTLVSILK